MINNNVLVDYKKQLNLSLSANITTKALACVCTWATVNSNTQNVVRTTLTDIIPKIVIPTPPINFDRQLKYLKIINNDSISAIVLVNVNSVDNSNYNLNIASVLLSPNDTLFYTIQDGFFIIDYNGTIKPIQNTIEISSTPISSGTTSILDYYTKPQTDLLLLSKSSTGHTHEDFSLSGGVSNSQFIAHTGATNPHGTTLTQLGGVSTTDFIAYTGTTNPEYSLTSHTHSLASLNGVSTADFINHTGATNPHGTTLTQLSGVSTTIFNSYTASTDTLYTQSAYGSLYAHNSGATLISVMNTGTTGWKTAISNTHLLTTFTDNSTADRITISSGGSGTYQLNVIVNANFSSAIPVYSMGVYKNNILIPQAQSYVSPANTTDRFNLTTNTIVSGVVANDFFDVRFSSDNATARNIGVFHMTFNMNRIG